MVNLRMRKILRDLWSNKSRTFLVVLSIAIGVFALSLTLRTQALLSANMLTSYAAIGPAEITLTADPFDEQFVKAIRTMSGVRAATGINQFQVRVKIGTEWHQLILTAVDDFTDMPINRLVPAGGSWPPPKRTLALERSYLDAVGGKLGAALTIEAPDGRQYQMPVSGLAHDLTAISGRLGSDILFGYISMDTLEWLRQPRAFNQLQIAVDGDPFDAAHVRHVAAETRNRLEDEHLTVASTRIREPDKPELYNIIASILKTLAGLGMLSLVLSTFLVMNTIAGLLARQVPQIGVLKAIGAPASDIVGMYLSAVLIFALLGLVVALPLGVLGARLLTIQLAQLLNYDIQSFSVPPYVIALEAVAGLIVPLLAALYPIFAGTRVTVRQAISGQGGDQFGTSALDQLSGRIRGIPAALLYAFRNMLRRKGRLALTLATLALGGAIVIAVLSVRASLFATLDQVTDYWQQDITVTFDRPYPTAEIASQVLRVAGVTSVDYQTVVLGARQRPDGSESDEASAIFGVTPTTDMLRPTLIRGRWLAPADMNALVVNIDFMKHEPDVAIGDLVTLNIAGRKTKWQVVGVVTTQMVGLGSPKPGQPMVYASYDSLAAAQHEAGDANRAVIATARHDPAFQAQVAQALEAQFASSNRRVIIQTRAGVRDLIAGLFSTIVLLLLVMAALFIVVGGVGLTGAMSLNVLERTKEIGILRAIGASNSSVMRIVLAEGICIGLVSWLLAALMAIPLSHALGTIIGTSMLSWPLAYIFPPAGVLIWLAAVIVLAAIASYLPARGATRLTVRDVLAYE
jgi:putative ABC transport system permease protein